MEVYAQLGEVLFESLNGFDTYSEQDDAVISQYRFITGKPGVNSIATNAREVTIFIRLHQRFVDVRKALLILRGYKDNGLPLSLIWGNGNVEGVFLISTMNTSYEEQTGNGGLIAASLNIQLIETTKTVLDADQASALKGQYGVEGNVPHQDEPVVPVVPGDPAVDFAAGVREFVQKLAVVNRYAGIINGLIYAGSKYQGKTLGQICGNMRASFHQLQQNYGVDGLDDIVNSMDSTLSDLESIDVDTEPALAKLKNVHLQMDMTAMNGLVSADTLPAAARAGMMVVSADTVGYVKTIAMQNDTWYSIAYRMYGSMRYSRLLMLSNPGVPLNVGVAVGTVLNVPVIRTVSGKVDSSVLPPWKL